MPGNCAVGRRPAPFQPADAPRADHHQAGHETWPRLFQNLRASCETDWVERYPAHAVATWLGHSPKVAAEHYLMSRERYFEDVVGGGKRPDDGAGQGSPRSCDAIATRNATPQASAPDGTRSHETPEPAATTRVTAGSSGLVPVSENRPVGSTGCEQPAFRAGNPEVAISCDAKCDAISSDLVELLARAVLLVAGMKIPEQMRAAVLDRVIADLGVHPMQQPEG